MVHLLVTIDSLNNTSMSRMLWGEFTEHDSKSASIIKSITNEAPKFIPTGVKRMKLSEIQNQMLEEEEKITTLLLKNPMVTQTIEVMKQTEMLQSLIDTYSNKSGTSNYLLNPCQLIPEVNFPPENVVNLVNNNKYTKPIWFIPPQGTKFTKGIGRLYPQLSAQICRAALRKAVCGQLRVAGFTDTADSALILFSDATEEFLKNFMEHMRDVHATNPKFEKQREIEPKNLEKAYCSVTNTSLTQVHNYFKHHLITRNRNEISEFNDVLHEYDKLMKESQNMQKGEFQDGDFVNIFEMSSTSGDCGNPGILHNNHITLQLDTKSTSERNNFGVDMN